MPGSGAAAVFRAWRSPSMDTFYGYIRTSRRAQEGVSGAAGANRRRGWPSLDARISGGDTLVVAAIDRIGRTCTDTIRAIAALQERGVKIRSLAESEAQCTKYLEAEAGSPEAFSCPTSWRCQSRH